MNKVEDMCHSGPTLDEVHLRVQQASRENATLRGDLDITGQVTIQGAGAATTIVDASRLEPPPVPMLSGIPGLTFLVRQPGDRAFDVLPGTNVVREGVTVQGAFTADNGAGIANAGALTIRRSIVTGNVSYSTAGQFDLGGDFAGGGIANTGTLNVMESSIRDNSGDRGGGVWNAGQMRVIASTIANNVASGECIGSTGFPSFFSGCFNGTGGGIYNAKDLIVSDSTIVDNWAGGRGGTGGAIYNAGTLEITSATVSGNQAGGQACTEPPGCFSFGIAGGLFVEATASARVTASILAGSALIFDSGGIPVPPPLPGDCVGPVISQGSNLIQNATGCTITGTTAGNQLGVDPKLGPLQDNGGPTFTRALLPGSPAIDAAVAGTCPATDQRGVSRPQDGNFDGRAVCDIGAFEFQPPVTFASLCTLSRQLVTNAPLANGMCNTLEAAQRSNEHGLPNVKEKLLSTYAGLVDTAQRIGAVTAEQALRLKSLAETL